MSANRIDDQSPNNAPALDVKQLRRTFGEFSTGVTVVTYRDDEGNPRGATMNSFTSVSMDPPLALISVARSARACDALAERPFTVNILSANQLEDRARLRGQADRRPRGALARRGIVAAADPGHHRLAAVRSVADLRRWRSRLGPRSDSALRRPQPRSADLPPWRVPQTGPQAASTAAHRVLRRPPRCRMGRARARTPCDRRRTHRYRTARPLSTKRIINNTGRTR